MGEFFGLLIIIFYGLAALNFCLKFLNRNYNNILKKNEDFYKLYMILLKFFVKNHRYFGGTIIIILLTHFILQFSRFGFSITGGIAASLMMMQIGLGVYGQYKKNKNKIWLVFHRGIALALLIAILIHVV